MREYLQSIKSTSMRALFEDYKESAEHYLDKPSMKSFNNMEKDLLNLFFKTKLKKVGLESIIKEIKTEQQLTPLYNNLIGKTS